MSNQMFTAIYTVYVERDAPAGPSGDWVEVKCDFDTSDVDHAYELADRALSSGVVTLPARASLPTLRINMEQA